MFEHFTFGAQAPQYTHEDAFPSPTDCSFTPETPSPTRYDGEEKGGLNDIVNKLSEQSLRPDDERSLPSIWNYSNTILTPDFDNEVIEFTPEELLYMSTTRGIQTLSPQTKALPNMSHDKSGTVACRRLQRQLNVQLQTCSTHVRDLSALVEDMIENNSQCRLRTSPMSSTTPFTIQPLELDDTLELVALVPDLDEDEGFAEMEDDGLVRRFEDELEMSLRRASTPSGIRKRLGDPSMRYRSSADCAPSARKVRSMPRMRKRKPKVASV